jgi:tetratricopeptide (TPR) repeat protein
LQRADIIRGTPAPDGREKLFRVIDRVFAHYYRLRQGDAAVRTSPLQTILDFLRSFYSREEQRSQAAHYLDLGRPAEAAVFGRLSREGEAATGASGYRTGFASRLRRYLEVSPGSFGLPAEDLAKLLEREPEQVFQHCQPGAADTTPVREAVAASLRAQMNVRMGFPGKAEATLREAIHSAAGDPLATIIAGCELSFFLNRERLDRAGAASAAGVYAVHADADVPPVFRVVALSGRAWALGDQERFAGAVVAAAQGAAIAAVNDEYGLQAVVERQRAWNLNKLRRYDEALAAADTAAALALRAGSVSEQAAAARERASNLGQFRRHAEAIAAADEAAGLLERIGDRGGMAGAIGQKAWNLGQLRRYDEALAAAVQATGIATQAVDGFEQAGAWRRQAWLLGRLRRFEEAIGAADRAVALAVAAGSVPEQIIAARHKAWSLGQLGRHAEAVSEAERVAAQARQRGNVFEEAVATRLKAWNLVKLAAHEPAIAAAQAAADLAARAGDLSEQAEALRHAAFSLKELGRPEEAWLLVVRSLDLAERADDPFNAAWAAHIAISIAEQTPRPEISGIFAAWLARHLAAAADDAPDPARSVGALLAAVTRARVWPAFDALARAHGDWFAKAFRPEAGAGIGKALADVFRGDGRAATFATAGDALRRLAELSRTGADGRWWLSPLVAAFAAGCRNAGMLRDFAGLIEDDMAPDAAEQRTLLLRLADYDASLLPVATLARLDPDIAVFVRRFRGLPDEAPERPAAAGRRKKPG